MKVIHNQRWAAALLGICFCSAALAQYVWTDEKGTRQYSDRPPPANVPQKRILKAPASAAAGQRPAADAPAAADPTAKPAEPSLAQKNADFNKRRVEQAEKEKKAAEAASTEKERRAQCERIAGQMRALESGERITRTDKDGERTALSDAQRAQEIAEARKLSAECK